MDSEIKNLINCLSVEKGLYEKAVCLSEAKKDAITKEDFPKLDEIIEKESCLIKEIKQIDQKRSKLSAEVSKQLCIDKENATISDIIEKIDNIRYKNQLALLLEDFNIIIKAQRELNEANKLLIEKNLQYIRFMLSTIVLEDDNITYGKGANADSAIQKINIFDQRA